MSSSLGMRDRFKKAPGAQMRIRIGVCGREDWSSSDSILLQTTRNLHRGILPSPDGQIFVEFLFILQTTSSGRKLFVRDPVGSIYGIAQALPFSVIGYGNRYPRTFSSARIDIVWSHPGMMIPQGTVLPLVHLGI
jgi:hypothetical protein